MQKIMRDTAMRLMQGGQVPSVSEVAEAAEVSRATAYRHFPSQASIIQAAVNEALRPILDWESDSEEGPERIGQLFTFAYPHMLRYETLHRAALRTALEQWARRQAGTFGAEERLVRGNRKAVLGEAAAPLRAELGKATFDKLLQSLSLLFGVEAMIVLKDIWGLDGEEARRVAMWAAAALIQAATKEAEAGRSGPARKKKANAAKRPRRTRK